MFGELRYLCKKRNVLWSQNAKKMNEQPENKQPLEEVTEHQESVSPEDTTHTSVESSTQTQEAVEIEETTSIIEAQTEIIDELPNENQTEETIAELTTEIVEETETNDIATDPIEDITESAEIIEETTETIESTIEHETAILEGQEAPTTDAIIEEDTPETPTTEAIENTETEEKIDAEVGEQLSLAIETEETIDRAVVAKHIEALFFTASKEMTSDDIEKALRKSLSDKIDVFLIEEVIQDLNNKFESEEYVYTIRQINNGYRMLTKAEYHKSISQYIQVSSRKRLSTAAMETLAIIAYKQPTTRSEIEKIRGVNCDYAVQKLLEKELIAIVGRSESVGKPLLYGTSQQFMDHFGLKSIGDLPQLKEVIPQHNQIGNPEDSPEDSKGNPFAELRAKYEKEAREAREAREAEQREADEEANANIDENQTIDSDSQEQEEAQGTEHQELEGSNLLNSQEEKIEDGKTESTEETTLEGETPGEGTVAEETIETIEGISEQETEKETTLLGEKNVEDFGTEELEMDEGLAQGSFRHEISHSEAPEAKSPERDRHEEEE